MMKLLNWCESLSTYGALLATGIMVCLTTADTILRYLFARPITGTYEISEKYLMLATVFLGLGYAYREGATIRVTILINRLPRLVVLIINHFVQLLSVVYMMVLTFATTQQALHYYASGETFSAITSPLWPASALIPLGLLFMLLRMLLDFRNVRKGESALFKEDLSTN